MYEPCTTNAQTELVVRTAGGHQEIPFFSPLQLSPALLISLPSHHLPREAAVKAARTHCPPSRCPKAAVYRRSNNIIWRQATAGLKHVWAIPNCLPTGKDANIWCWVNSSHICFSFGCNPSQPLILFPELTWKQASAKIKQLVLISSLLSWLYLLRAAVSRDKQCLGNEYLCLQLCCLQ